MLDAEGQVLGVLKKKPAEPVAVMARQTWPTDQKPCIGQVTFLDRHRNAVYYPLGSTRMFAYNTPTGPVSVLEPAPVVQFNDHRYQTEDLELVQAMLLAKNYFCQPWGYNIVAEGLPKKIAAKWPRMHTENRRQVMLALATGATEDQALAFVDESLGDRGVGPRLKVGRAGGARCTVCGFIPENKDGSPMEGDEAVAAIVNHSFALHAEGAA